MGNSSAKVETTSTYAPYAETKPESTEISDLMKSGRYKVAKPETLEMMRQMNAPQDSYDSSGNKIVVNNSHDVQQPQAPVRDIKEYIIEQEGLDIGKKRRRMLSQQWRFYLSCEPMQRGLDAGLILGSLTAAIGAYKFPKYRIPGCVFFMFLGGFSVGLISVPVMVVLLDQTNVRRIKRKEQELFERQRSEFRNR